jgi:hypothetical protein
VLHAQLVRELHYWLLAGRHGRRCAGWAGRTARPSGWRARSPSCAPISPAAAGRAAGGHGGHEPVILSPAFPDATSLSPLQFQKQLRLIEARRLMLAEGAIGQQRGLCGRL